MAGINVNLRGLTTTETDARYYQQSQFIDTTTGVADAAKPVETNASGLVDDTFIANSVLKSETISSTAGVADAGKVPKTDAAGKLDVSFLPPSVGAVNDFSAGRLCLATGAPDTINQTGSATLYWTPYKGNTISLVIGGTITEKTFTEQSIDFSAKTAAKTYDIFAYWDSGTGEVKIEELVWTDDTTRATDLTLSNGVYYKLGDTTRKYLGTVYAYDNAGTTKIRDEKSYRYVCNYYNKLEKHLITYNSTASWTYSTNTSREWNGGSGQIRGNFILGISQEIISKVVGMSVTNATDYDSYNLGIAYDETSITEGDYSYSNIYGNLTVTARAYLRSCGEAKKILAQGLHYMTGVERMPDATTATVTSSGYGIAKISC